ncbi:histidinol-phosphate transaminase [Paenibacillus athensensis]|uniref:Histidinol-phosphate aminotransferase n=1 Tax=Paenibacillus athensensis TaxID=1967502 RepID=A0A4Y8PWI8_9BACL|nr:histidinol-phosphate transaminase [Paenibacillus athensensis]MCD1261467.1 histidinol-phosphate transaminase [Paenibacillus athensensis]
MKEQISPKPRKTLERIKDYTPGKPIWEVREELGLKQVIKLASNENPLGPAPKALEALERCLGELHRYPDAEAVGLRRALAAKLALEEDQLLIGNGADELIRLISETFLEAGDEIVIPAPTFGEYEFGANLMDAAVVSVPLDDGFGLNAAALLAAVNAKTKLVYLCSPNNPTGTYLPQAELELLLAGLPPRTLLIVDAAYGHYATAADYANGLDFVRRGLPVVVLQTFSKIYGLAGLRIGCAAAPAAVIAAIRKVKEPFNVNALAQAAGAAALDDDAFVEASRRMNDEGRRQLYAGFGQLGVTYTESMSNFVLARLGSDAQKLYERLLGKGIIVRNGGSWGLPEHVRITVGTPEENALLLQALGELLAEAGE